MKKSASGLYIVRYPVYYLTMTTTTVADTIAYGGDYFADSREVLHVKDVLADTLDEQITTECGLTLPEADEIIPVLTDPVCPLCAGAVKAWMDLDRNRPRN